MSRPLLIALALAAAGCSSSNQPCHDLAHAACDLDAGSTCDTRSICLAAGYGVDICAHGASACCYSLCSADSDCPSGENCVTTEVAKVCAQGRCLQ